MEENEQYESPSEEEEDQYRQYSARRAPARGGQNRSDEDDEETEEGQVYEEDATAQAAPPDEEEATAEEAGEDDEEGAAEEEEEEEGGGAEGEEDEAAAAAKGAQEEGAEEEEEAEGAEGPQRGDGGEGGDQAAEEEEGGGGGGPWGEGEGEFGGGEDFDELEGEDAGALGKRLSQIRDPFPTTDEKILEHLLEASKQAYARIARIEDIRAFIKEYEEVRDQEGRPKDEKQPPEIKKAREDLIKELEKFDAIVRRIDRLCSLTNVYSPEDYLPPLQRQPIADAVGKRLSELMDQLELEKVEKRETGCCAYCAREEALPKMVVCGTTDHVPMVVFCDPGGRKLGKPPDCSPNTCTKRGPGGGGGGGGGAFAAGRKYRECDRFHGPEDIAGVAGANAILDQVNYMSDEIKKLRLENMKLSYRLNSMNVFQEVDDSIARAAMTRGAGGAGQLTPNAPCARPGNFRRPGGMSAGMGGMAGMGGGSCTPSGYPGRQASSPMLPSSAMMPDSALSGRPPYSGPALSVAVPTSCGITSCHTSRGGMGGGGYGSALPLYPLRLRGSGADLETRARSRFPLMKSMRTRSYSFGSPSNNVPCLRLRGAGPVGGCGSSRPSARARSPLRPACHPHPPPPKACGLTPDPCPPITTLRSSYAGPGHRTWPPQKPAHKSMVFGSGPWLSQPMGARVGSGVGGLSCPNCAPSGIGFDQQQPPPKKEPPGCACEYQNTSQPPLRPSQDLKQRRWYGKRCTCPPASFGSSEFCDCDCNRGLAPQSISRPTGWLGPDADAQCVPECGNSSTSEDVDKDGCGQYRPKPTPCCAPRPCFDPLNICKGPDPQCPDMVSQMERQLQDMECDVARMKRELSVMQRFNEELEKESMSTKCPCPETSKCKPNEEKDKKDKDKDKDKNKNKNKDRRSSKDRNGNKNKDGKQRDRKGSQSGDQRSRSESKSGQSRSRTSSTSGQNQNSGRGSLNDKVGKNEGEQAQNQEGDKKK